MINSYQKTLHDIAKIMVRVHAPSRLLKIITRLLYREMSVTSVAIAICDKAHSRYVFYDSKGKRRIPLGLIKLDMTNALIEWFAKGEHNTLSLNRDYITLDIIDGVVHSVGHLAEHALLAQHLVKVREVLHQLSAHACFPAYYKKELLGLLFVGQKNTLSQFEEEELLFLQTLAYDASMAMKTAEYQEALENKVLALEKSLEIIKAYHSKEKEKYLQTILTLANTVDAKDPYTFGHCEEIERWGMLLLEYLTHSFDESRKRLLSSALKLHDVGKLGVPDEILKKPARLTPAEWAVMKEHVTIGARILAHHDDFKNVADIILYHHENVDGSGYPCGLRGDEIPLEARIIAVVDAFHAMVSDRPYRKGMPHGAAIQELKANAGKQFDQEIVTAFLKVIDPASPQI